MRKLSIFNAFTLNLPGWETILHSLKKAETRIVGIYLCEECSRGIDFEN